MITDLHFIRPLVLLALPIVLFIIWQLQRSSSKDDGWAKICDQHLLDAIKVNTGGKGSKLSLLLYPIMIIAILALAGPAFRKVPTPIIKNQSALVIALDVSRSMLADDIKPNRLERAKYKINDILANRKDGQTALLVYAGDAFVVTPLTDDTETIALMLKAISPEIMPVQGSRVDIALQKSQELLKQAGYISGDVLLLCDGVNSSQAEPVAEQLADHNIRVSVLAIGTKAGAPISTPTGFVKDKSGNIVVPKLQISALRKLVTSGNGRFAEISGDSADVDYLAPAVSNDKDQPSSNQEETANTEKFIDEGPWLALLLLPLVALLFRKGMLLTVFLVVGLHSPQPSYAFDWGDMWLNADQQAAKQLQNNEPEQAFATAKSDQWKATAAFRNKDYKQAQSLFDDGSADGFYNQGNALAADGKLAEAIKSYDQALKLRANDEDTLYNKKQVEAALEQQKQQEQEQQEQQEKDNKEDKEQQNQEPQDQQQEQQDQDSKDGEGEKQEGEDGEQNQENQEQQDNPEQQEQEEQQEQQLSEEEKQKQQEQQKQLEQADKEQQAKEQDQQQEQQVKLTPEELAEQAENKEAIEQWLRRIPDDPGGLLRRKFYYQYNQQNNKPDEIEDW